MTKANEFKKHLRPGEVYRRQDLAGWSKAVDRHLKELVEEGALTRLATGLYLYPKETVFGKAPPEAMKLVASFLKDRHFLLASPNAYNSLGVGTTQRLSAVRWGVAGRVVWAWILTIPAAFTISWVVELIVKALR